MTDRGMIKWLPFQSCYSQSKAIKEIQKKKNRQTLPILSEDQFLNIQEKIYVAYQAKENINVEYFYNGEIKKTFGSISYINVQEKTIYINKTKLHFCQILNVF